MYICSKLCHWTWKFGLEASRFQTPFYANTVLFLTLICKWNDRLNGWTEALGPVQPWQWRTLGHVSLVWRVCSTPAPDVRIHYWTLSQVDCFYIPKPPKTQFTKYWMYGYSFLCMFMCLPLWACLPKQLTLKHALPNSHNTWCIAIHRTPPALCTWIIEAVCFTNARCFLKTHTYAQR